MSSMSETDKSSRCGES